MLNAQRAVNRFCMNLGNVDDVAKARGAHNHYLKEFSFKFEKFGLGSAHYFAKFAFIVLDAAWWNSMKKTVLDGKEVNEFYNRDAEKIFNMKEAILHDSTNLPNHVTIAIPKLKGEPQLWKTKKFVMVMATNVLRLSRELDDEDNIMNITMFARFQGEAVQV